MYRREDNYVGKRVERLVIRRKKRGRPKRRWRDNIQEDLRVIDAQEEDAMVRASGGRKSAPDLSQWKKMNRPSSMLHYACRHSGADLLLEISRHFMTQNKDM